MKNLYRKIISERIRHKVYLNRCNLSKSSGYTLRSFFDKDGRKFPKRLSKFKDKYKGQRCFIMGNGPSINKMDLELLKDEIVWGSNRCYLLYDKITWKHKYYVSVDTRVLPDIADEIHALAENSLIDLFIPYSFYHKNIIQKKENIFFFNEIQQFPSQGPEAMFSKNASKWLASVNTVTITAIQLAFFMGFKDIFLIGCDTSYKIPQNIIYENNDKEKLISLEDNDLNHFDNRYFGKGRKWHDPHTDRMIEHYKFVKLFLDSTSTTVYNATIGGNLEVFERIDFNTLFD